MSNAYCTGCRQLGHWLPDCPERKLEKVKKPWVKPEIRRYVRVDSLTGEVNVRQLESNKKFDKKAYQREYMRRKRSA